MKIKLYQYFNDTRQQPCSAQSSQMSKNPAVLQLGPSFNNSILHFIMSAAYISGSSKIVEVDQIIKYLNGQFGAHNSYIKHNVAIPTPLEVHIHMHLTFAQSLYPYSYKRERKSVSATICKSDVLARTSEKLQSRKLSRSKRRI